MIDRESIKIEAFVDKDTFGVDTKFGHRLNVCVARNETTLTIFDKDYIFWEVPDIELLALINVICMINTVETYWSELKRQNLKLLERGGVGNSNDLTSLFWDEQKTWIDENHKRWFRDKKLDGLITETEEEWEGY